MKISIIIPAYNEESYIGDCLTHIAHFAPDAHEVIVVDNASTDNTCQIVNSFANVIYIYEGKKGLTQARQTGYLAATGDIIAYIDADSHIRSNRYQKVSKNFANEKIGFLSGPYYYYDMGVISQIGSFIYRVFFAYPIYLCIGYLGIGGNMIFRKSILDKMGGFDTSIEFYGEDTNAARRAHDFAKCKYDLNLIISTSARRFAKQGFRKTCYIYVINFFSEVIKKKPANQDYEDYR